MYEEREEARNDYINQVISEAESQCELDEDDIIECINLGQFDEAIRGLILKGRFDKILDERMVIIHGQR